MSEIKNSYLMWIGKEHYSKINDWTDEAVSMGISKRLPNVDMAAALQAEGTAIFVAHDEGEYSECNECLGEIENPEWRKAEAELARVRKEVEDLNWKGSVAMSSHGLSERKMEEMAATGERPKISKEAQAEADRCDKLVANRVKKIKKLVAVLENITETVKGGTGGKAIVDGKVWDYRKYNYNLHQPQRFNVDQRVGKKEMCETCGGTGRLPEGKVFGLFLPSAIEYILKAEDGEEVKKQMEQDRGFETVTGEVLLTEAKRGCGKRKAGGVYVVTRGGDKPTKRAEDLVKALVEAGDVKPEAVEINGDFIRFLAPIDIDCKRFRGLKKWNLDPRAEAEAEMILEAVG